MRSSKSRKPRCELLAPAGTANAFIAAVESGADAVYCGGKAFNARIGAGNFDDEDLKDAVAFAHKRLVKTYVTVNTLIGDDELMPALRYAGKLAEYGTDALIVQDVGFGSLVRKHIPELPIHMSTQGSVYDLRGVETAAKLGYSRVVTARELSFEEIKRICASTDTEIEVFCHGAQCICYSGQCQMSRALGGRSGNRGACAQPCRLMYDGKYLLSPADLSLIDHIGELAGAGVASLKIEGRMKSPEYVSVVTGIYRKYLDEYYTNGSYRVSPDDREALAQIFSRGFTDAYFDGYSKRSFMSGEIPKNKGVLIGEVINESAGRDLVDISLTGKLEQGDGVEIRGDDRRTGNVVTYYKELGARKIRIGDIKEAVKAGDKVYRITSSSQLKAAALSYSSKTWNEGKFTRRTKLTADLSSGGGMVNLCLREPITGTSVKSFAGPFEESGDAADERIKKALKKTGSTPFEIASISLHGDFRLNARVSEINEMRRSALSDMEQALASGRPAAKIPDSLRFEPMPENGAELELYFFKYDDFKEHVEHEVFDEKASADGVRVRYIIPAVEFAEHFDEVKDKCNVVPYITNISKGREDCAVEANFDLLLTASKERGIYIGNLSWLIPFISAGGKVFGDYGLNIYNEASKSAFSELGVSDYVKSLEAESPKGRFPLMISEHKQEADSFKDRKGASYEIIKRNFSDQEILIAAGKSDITDISEGLPVAVSGNCRVRMYI